MGGGPRGVESMVWDFRVSGLAFRDCGFMVSHGSLHVRFWDEGPKEWDGHGGFRA